MRKTKLGIISTLAMVGVIGLAWAIFVFGGTATATNSTGNVTLEAYAAVGTVTYGTGSGTLTIDNATDIGAAANKYTVDVTYTPGTNDTHADVALTYNTPTAAFVNTALNTYLDINLSTSATWGPANKTVTITVTLSWKAGQEPSETNQGTVAGAIAQWEAIQTALGTSGITITSSVTLAAA